MIDGLAVYISDEVRLQDEYAKRLVEKRPSLGSPYAALAVEQGRSTHPESKGRVFTDSVLSYGQAPGAFIKANHCRYELKRVHQLSADDIVFWIRRAFELSVEQVLELDVARVDLAADVWHVPVKWFQDSVGVAHKRAADEWGGWRKHLQGPANSLSFGTKGDRYIIYDKIGEMQARRTPLLYHNMENEPPPVITRVERQCSGRGVPTGLKKLGDMLRRAPAFDPFERLTWLSAKPALNTDNWKARRWLMNLGLATAVRGYGLFETRKRLNKGSGGKASQYFERYSDVLKASGGGVTPELLRAVYQRSTLRQLQPALFMSEGDPSVRQTYIV